MTSYSAKVLEYFLNPAHAEKMDNPDGVGVIGDIECGDYFVIYIRVRDDRLIEISFQVFGCPAAIVTCEAVAVLATGMSLKDAREITDEEIYRFLGGLPERKLHCSHSAAEALQAAIFHYQIEQSKRNPIGSQPAFEREESHEEDTNATR
jgi:nitrogen fixation NifU-like protein